MSTPSPQPVDLLEQAIAYVRPLLRDGPTKRVSAPCGPQRRTRAHLAADDVVHDAFMRLAVEVGLIDRRGYWTGTTCAPTSADTGGRTLRT